MDCDHIDRDRVKIVCGHSLCRECFDLFSAAEKPCSECGGIMIQITANDSLPIPDDRFEELIAIFVDEHEQAIRDNETQHQIELDKLSAINRTNKSLLCRRLERMQQFRKTLNQYGTYMPRNLMNFHLRVLELDNYCGGEYLVNEFDPVEQLDGYRRCCVHDCDNLVTYRGKVCTIHDNTCCPYKMYES